MSCVHVVPKRIFDTKKKNNFASPNDVGEREVETESTV